MIAIAACGGGSGGGSSGGSGPPPPSSGLTAAFIPTRAADTVRDGTTLFEVTLQLADLAGTALRKAAESGALQSSYSCRNGGLADLDLTDVDMDGLPSPGDTLRVTYRDCSLVDVNPIVAGDFVIKLEPPAAPAAAGETVYAGTFDAAAMTIHMPGTVTVTGDISFEARQAPLGEFLAAGGNAQFTIGDGAAQNTEGLQDFEFTKQLSYETGRYSLSVAGQIDSQLLGGTFRYDGTHGLGGYFDTYPEQGQLEFVGRDGARFRVVPSAGTDNDKCTIDLDEKGTGDFSPIVRPAWTELVQGFLWWYREANPLKYVTRLYVADDFFMILGVPANDDVEPVTTGMRLQFSRPLDAASVPAALTAKRTFMGYPYDSATVSLNVDVEGAAILLTPSEQLDHKAWYNYPVEHFSVQDQSGNTTAVSYRRFITDDTLDSDIVADPRFALGGESIMLDGSSSQAVDSPIASYRWTQIAGTPGTFDTPNQATTVFHVPAIAASEQIVIQLEVTNTEGVYDRERVDISVFASEQAIRMMFVGATEGANSLSYSLDWWLSSTNGDFSISRYSDNSLSFFYTGIDPPQEIWHIIIAAPGGAELTAGTYEGVTYWPADDPTKPAVYIHNSNRGCGITDGRFDVFEISYDANGDILSAAIDFELYCLENPPPIFGSIRIGDSRPITIR